METSIDQILQPVECIKTCTCGNKFSLPNKFLEKYVKHCPDCAAKAEKEYIKKLLDSQSFKDSNEWNSLCPKYFQETQIEMLPKKFYIGKALDWVYGPKGLILHGNTGTGKSRCAWLLMKREFNLGKRVTAIGCDFGFKFSANYSRSSILCDEWIEDLSNSALLLMDDVFKTKLTDAAEQALFCIVNKRTENKKPMLITLNDVGESLKKRMSQDRGEPMLKRITENTEQIAFL